jgi:AraC-like DNA-binding protein
VVFLAACALGLAAAGGHFARLRSARRDETIDLLGPPPPVEQVDAGRDWFSPGFDVTPREPGGAGFLVENVVWATDGMVVSRVREPAVRVARSGAQLRRNLLDHWVITVCRHDSTRISTKSGSLRARAGLPFLWSLGEASESERSEVNRVQLFLSRDTFRDIAPLLDAARGSVLETPLGHLLADFVLAIEQRLPGFAAADLVRLTGVIRSLVAACVAPSLERLAIARDAIEFERLERVRQAVEKHLYSPELGPGMLCRAVGMSRSNLYRLLAQKGGVARYIQAARLREAHRILCDVTDKRTIARIAEDLCFADASSFGRAFRKEFGHSASEVRAAGLAGQPIPAMPVSNGTLRRSDFVEPLAGPR